MITKTMKSRVALFGTAVLTVFALASCAGTAAEPGGADAPNDGTLEVVDLKVGIVPVVDMAGIFRAIDGGYFKDEGLNVTVQPAASGGTLGTALLSGDLQASSSTWPSWFLATSNAAPLRFVGMGVSGTEDTAGVYSAPESGITKPADLEGKTVAVNSLKNSGELTIRAVLEGEGVDSSAVSFTELPFPDMIGAVTQGSVDAVWVVEPFTTAAINAGLSRVLSSYSGPAKDIPVSGMAMLDSFVKKNPNTAAAFARALERGNADLAADPALAREILLKEPFNQAPAVVETMSLPAWTAGFPSEDKLEIWNELMMKFDLLSSPVDLKSVTFAP